MPSLTLPVSLQCPEPACVNLIDSHCHLEKFQKWGDYPAVLDRAREHGVDRVITVGTRPQDWSLYREMAASNPGQIDYTVGVHPTSVEDDWEGQLESLASYFIPPVEPVALGEIGLDYFHLPKDPIEGAKVIEKQEHAFRAQLDLAHQLECPVVIHSRGAVTDCIRMIDESGVDWSRVVFHCWVDGPEVIAKLNERGGVGSFTGIFTFKNAEEIRQAALAQGLDRLMLETDAPYLAPVPFRGKQNEPGYTRYIAESAADVFSASIEDIIQHSRENTIRFFNLS